MTDAEVQRARLPWLAVVAAGWLLTVDATRLVPAVGGLSLSGVATLAVFVACLLWSLRLLGRRSSRPSWESHRYEPLLPRSPATRLPAPLTAAVLLFLGWLLIRPTAEGVQNVAVYLTFALGLAVVADSSSAGSEVRTVPMLRAVGLAATVIAAAAFAAGIEVYGERAYALAAIPILALTIPLRGGSFAARFGPYLILLAIGLSLSRTALFVGVALMVFRVVRAQARDRWWRTAVIVAASIGALYYAVTSIPAIRDRFLVGDNASFGGFSLNTSGRSLFWDRTWRSFLEHPWFGGGPGSAAELIAARFGTITHPHNDWLRLLHDFGIVGAGLFACGYLTLLWGAWRRARRTDLTIHWSAVIVLLGVAAAAITDNVLVYPFVMVPAAVIVGLSRALPDRKEDEPCSTTTSSSSPTTTA